MTVHPLAGDPRLREVAVPVATVWTRPDAPRDLDAAVTADLPDVAAWVETLDAEGTADRRLGLHGRTLTQLLLGEAVLVLEEAGAWVRVAALEQASSQHEHGYPGWVRRAHLGVPAARGGGTTTATVTATTAGATRDDGVDLVLSRGTRCALADDPGGHGDPIDPVNLALPDRRSARVARADVHLGSAQQPTGWTPEDLLATARGSLGVRYLWGGTSAWGLDCSGLVHLTLRTHGTSLPRDAFDQAVAAPVRPVGLADVRPGDLYFFARPGERVYHVGFVSRPLGPDGVRWMLHAPEGGAAAIEDAPLAPHRLATLVGAGRIDRPAGQDAPTRRA